MKKILIAAMNIVLFLTIPLWAGFAIWVFIAKDWNDEKKPYLKEQWLQCFTGNKSFLDDLDIF